MPTDTGNEVRVAVASGVVAGCVHDGVVRFLGIPYAAAPFGANRLIAPQPVVPWTGVRSAAGYGPTAPKEPFAPEYHACLPDIDIFGDDCLNLNVWTPDPSSGGLPVLVFVHGGAFIGGAGSLPQYDGTAFARHGVVCVTLNYRLGAEGFLHLGDDLSNLGLHDQLAALQWVQTNIASFGGDPTRVTVAGESAGAMSVTALLSMARSRGLVAQAITQSGAARHFLTDEQGRMVSRRLAETLGVEPTRGGFTTVTPKKLSLAVRRLVEDVQSNPPDDERWGDLTKTLTPFAPTIDGHLMVDDPLTVFGSADNQAVPLLTGWNREESRLFFVASGAVDVIDDDVLAWSAHRHGLSADGIEVYRQNRPGDSPGDVLAAVLGDWTFALPAINLAETRAAGLKAPPTWVYRFDHPQDRSNHGYGAAHAAELPYVFGTIDDTSTHGLIGGSPSRAAVETAHGAWVRFVRDGDPGWRPYSPYERWVGLLSERLRVERDPAGDERKVWANGR